MFHAGTMANEVKGQIAANKGTLYRVDDKLEPKIEVTPVSISNGLAWNKEDDTFYYIDSPTRTVVAYDYNPNTGTICKRLSNTFSLLKINKCRCHFNLKCY